MYKIYCVICSASRVKFLFPRTITMDWYGTKRKTKRKDPGWLPAGGCALQDFADFDQTSLKFLKVEFLKARDHWSHLVLGVDVPVPARYGGSVKPRKFNNRLNNLNFSRKNWQIWQKIFKFLRLQLHFIIKIWNFLNFFNPHWTPTPIFGSSKKKIFLLDQKFFSNFYIITENVATIGTLTSGSNVLSLRNVSTTAIDPSFGAGSKFKMWQNKL